MMQPARPPEEWVRSNSSDGEILSKRKCGQRQEHKIKAAYYFLQRPKSSTRWVGEAEKKTVGLILHRSEPRKVGLEPASELLS